MTDNALPQQGPGPDRQQRSHTGQIGIGVVILVMGVLMLLDRTDLLSFDAGRLFPGLLLMALGLAQQASHWGHGRRRNPLAGFWLIVIGAWLLINETHAFGLTGHTSWPLLVIAGGLLIVLRGVFPDIDRRRS